MLKSPALYSVSADYQEDDPGLVQKRADIIHSAAALLEKCNLVKYERASGRFQSTELGRIASHYYVTHYSMSVYNQHLRPTMSQLELFRVFALSNEFKLIPVRQEVRSLFYGPVRLCLMMCVQSDRRSLSSANCSNGYPFRSRRAPKSPRRRLTSYYKPIYHSSNLKVTWCIRDISSPLTNLVAGFALVADMVFVQQSAGRYAFHRFALPYLTF